MSNPTPGRRIYPDSHGNLWLSPGDYGKGQDGVWLACPPNFYMGSLAKHTVIEHEDGTITVNPSILIKTYDESGLKQWHGYLEKGIWREV